MESISLQLLVIKSHDVQMTLRFYQLLGFAFAEERHGNGPLHYSAPLGDGIIEIYPLDDGKSVGSGLRLGFAVPDPDAVVEDAAKSGGSVIKKGRETPWGYAAVVSDPDGRTVELYRA